MLTSNRQSPKPLRGYVLILVYMFIGLAISCLVVFDPYGTTYISHLVGIKLLPFTFVLLISIAIVVIFFLLKYLVKNIYKILENKELLFVIFYVVGYQTNSLELGIIDFSDIVLGMYLLIALISIFVERKERLINTPINLLNLLLLFFVMLSLVNSRVPTKTQLLYIKIILMYFLMVNTLYSKELVIKCVKWLIIITSCSAVFAIFQEFFFVTTGTLVVGMIEKEELKRMFEGGLFRVPALMVSYRVFAIILAIVLLLIISLLGFPNSLVRDFKKKMFLYSASFLISSALLLTQAKDVLLGFFVSLVFLLLFRMPRYFIHFIAVTLLLIAVALSFLAYFPGKEETIIYIVKDVPKEERERMQLDREGIQGFVHGDYMLSGRGRGNKYTANVHGWPAHNAFILIADEVGIFGLIIYSGMYAWILFRLVLLNFVVKDPAYLPIVRGLLCGIITYFIGAQFTASYVEPFLWVLFALTESSARILAKKSSSFNQTRNIIIV